MREKRIHVEGLPERINTFQHLSETTLQYCVDMGYVEVNAYNNVVVKKNPNKDKDLLTTSAKRLSKLIGKNSPAKVYATLGIRELELV